MIYQVQHTTTYTYPGTVSVCYNVTYLRPRDSAQQVCTGYELVVLPEPDGYSHYVDFFGNAVTFFAVQEPHRMLAVTARSTVEVTPRAALQCWRPCNTFLNLPTSRVVRACDAMRRRHSRLASHSSRRYSILLDASIPTSCMIPRLPL